MADPYRNLTAAQIAMTPLARVLAGTYQMVPYDAATNTGMYEDGHRLLFDAMMADIAALDAQMGTTAAAILAGANAPRTVVRLTSATFYEDGNTVGDYNTGQAAVLAQTAPGTGYVVSATYDAGNDRTVVTVDGITVDAGLTQCVLGSDPAYSARMAGATASNSGAIGAVPGPAAGQQYLALLGSAAFGIPPTHGGCRLVKVSTNLVLQRVGLGGLIINGVGYQVPVAGISLDPAGLSQDTTYNIYAYMNSGTMTLEASATAYSQDATTGIMIKTGDATRTLVGMARIITGPAWVDTAAQRFVISYFNRARITALNFFAANRTTTSTSLVELSSTERAEFLCFEDDDVILSNSVSAYNSGANNNIITIGVDGTTPIEGAGVCSVPGAGAQTDFSSGPVGVRLTSGYHYATLVGLAGAGTLTVLGAATTTTSAIARSAIKAMIRG